VGSSRWASAIAAISRSVFPERAGPRRICILNSLLLPPPGDLQPSYIPFADFARRVEMAGSREKGLMTQRFDGVSYGEP